MSSLPQMLKRFITDPRIRFAYLSRLGFYNHWSDEKYIKKEYFLNFGKELNLETPKSFNEKIQWLKIHDRKPIYTTMVDKLAAKEYVASLIGDEYIIPLLGVWDTPDEIDFESLPKQFVLKTTHDSGGIAICRDKTKLDIDGTKKKLRNSLRRDYYLVHREWPYKNVKPRIIAEQYMEDEEIKELKDYKIFCFDGIAKALFIASDRQTKGQETKFDFFDMNFKHLNIKNGHPNAEYVPAKPMCFNEMRTLAEKLSKGIPHLRVDFYEVNGKIYFGELTFSHWSGLVSFEPEEWDNEFGKWIKLPENTRGFKYENK